MIMCFKNIKMVNNAINKVAILNETFSSNTACLGNVFIIFPLIKIKHVYVTTNGVGIKLPVTLKP
jgi:hypothetical protein